jgi:hypothetical protein
MPWWLSVSVGILVYILRFKVDDVLDTHDGLLLCACTCACACEREREREMRERERERVCVCVYVSIWSVSVAHTCTQTT